MGHISNGIISNCYSIGNLASYSLLAYSGGLVGYNSSDISNCPWDTQTSGQADGVGYGSSTGTLSKTTAEMQIRSTFTGAGWDFLGETANGTEDIWRMCVDGLYYPNFNWERFSYGDFNCDGIDFYDLAILVDQWLLEKLDWDISLDGGDGIVNFEDWVAFADNWQGNRKSLANFASQWLMPSAHCADIAPAPSGDGTVNFDDFVKFADYWMQGL